jgi:hypothetical protein
MTIELNPDYLSQVWSIITHPLVVGIAGVVAGGLIDNFLSNPIENGRQT